MSQNPTSKNNKSLYPNEMLDNEEDDNSWQVSYLDTITILLGFLIILLSISDFSSATDLTSVSRLFKSSVQETEFLTTPIEEIQSELEESLETDLESGEIEIIRDLNDLLIRFSSDDLYRSGSATLQQEALPLFDRVISAIKANRFNDFDVEVEGHTDNTPISSAAYPSNWELSTTRATNVVKYFRGMGVAESRLKASGYADSKPLAANEDAAGNPLPKNKALNRRVDIRLYYASIPKRDSTGTESQAISVLKKDCRYSIQVGGFQSFNNSFTLANDAAKEIKYEFDITFNNNLFSVRSKSVRSLQEALTIHQDLSEYLRNKTIGVIHQCYLDNEIQPIPINYEIQVAAFQSENNAENYISSLNSQFGVSARISSDNNTIHKVMVGPFPDPVSASNNLMRLKNQGMSGGIFIKPLLGKILPYSFNFRIQIAQLNNQNAAKDLSQRLASGLNVETEISVAEDGNVYLLTVEFQEWGKATQVFKDLNDTDYDLSPVIYFLEKLTPGI